MGKYGLQSEMRELPGMVELFLILNGVVITEANTLNSALKSVHFKNIIYNSTQLLLKEGCSSSFPEEKQSTTWTKIRASVFYYCPLKTCH